MLFHIQGNDAKVKGEVVQVGFPIVKAALRYMHLLYESLCAVSSSQTPVHAYLDLFHRHKHPSGSLACLTH